jgi:hypothetical protein
MPTKQTATNQKFEVHELESPTYHLCHKMECGGQIAMVAPVEKGRCAWNGGTKQKKKKKAQPPEKTAGFGATLETSRVRVGRVHTEVKKSINKKDGVSVRGGMGWWGF